MKIKNLKNRDKWVEDQVRGKRVLHLGCVDYPLTEEKLKKGELLHIKIKDIAYELVGVDINIEGLERLSCEFPNLKFIAHNIENIDECLELQNEAFDVILAADILEHLNNPGNFLEGVHKIMNDRSLLIITTASAYSPKKFFYSLFSGKEHNHPNHTFYYSFMTLTELTKRFGFTILEFYTFAWKNLTFLNFLSNILSKPLIMISRNFLNDEVAIILRKSIV